MSARTTDDAMTCSDPKPNTSLRMSIRRSHESSRAIMNNKKATPNSARCAICPTSLIEISEIHGT